MAQKKITDMDLRTDFDATCNVPVDDTSQTWRATGAQIKAFVEKQSVGSKTATYVVLSTDNLLFGDSSGGAFQFTLPTASTALTGKRYVFKKTDTSFTAITVTDGTLTTTLNTLNESVEVYCSGSAWLVLRRTIPSAWTSFTPTGTWISNTTYTGKWRRVGDSIQIYWRLALSGAPTSANLTLNIPSGLTADTGGLLSTANLPIGHGIASDIGNENYPLVIYYNSTTACGVFHMGAATTNVTNGTNTSQSAPFTFGNTDTLFAYVTSLPITGWNP